MRRFGRASSIKKLLGVDAFLGDLASKLIVWPRYNDSWLATLSDRFVAGEVDEIVARAEIAKRGLWGTVTTPKARGNSPLEFANPPRPANASGRVVGRSNFPFPVEEQLAALARSAA